MRRLGMVFWAISVLLALPICAGPAQVVIIRHGEKPEHGNNLDERGKERAEALVGFFKDNPGVLEYGTPVAIYAMKPGPDDESQRPIETVEPLAKALDLKIHAEFGHDEYPKMAEEIKNSAEYDGKMVLICWEHKVIPQIAKALGVESAPAKWHGNVFDRVWVVSYSMDGEVKSFRNLPQHLLPGDSES
jgi:hypothetical protein